MIRETATNFDPGWGELIDVDVLEPGEWTGLFRSGEQLFIRTARSCVTAPGGVRFPLVGAHAGSDGQPAVYGVRPEHFSLADDGAEAEIVVVEPTRVTVVPACKRREAPPVRSSFT